MPTFFTHRPWLGGVRVRRLFGGEAGFSLVELSIALMIIGLIVGGIIKGQDLIESARLKAVMGQINTYQVAVQTYYDRFDRLPGDDDGAARMDRRLTNGNGDGVIGEGESVHFWRHLAAAGLVALPDQHGGLPTTKMGGHIGVRYHPQDDMPGHWFVLGKWDGRSFRGLLTPRQAMAFTQKAGGNRPDQGSVRGVTAPGASKACVVSDHSGTMTYHLNHDEPTCILYVQFAL